MVAIRNKLAVVKFFSKPQVALALGARAVLLVLKNKIKKKKELFAPICSKLYSKPETVVRYVGNGTEREKGSGYFRAVESSKLKNIISTSSKL